MTKFTLEWKYDSVQLAMKTLSYNGKRMCFVWE